jgi:hypothetical protein
MMAIGQSAVFSVVVDISGAGESSINCWHLTTPIVAYAGKAVQTVFIDREKCGFIHDRIVRVASQAWNEDCNNMLE